MIRLRPRTSQISLFKFENQPAHTHTPKNVNTESVVRERFSGKISHSRVPGYFPWTRIFSNFSFQAAFFFFGQSENSVQKMYR